MARPLASSTTLTPGAAVWPAAMIVWGPGFTSAVHRHHCIQLIMAISGTFWIRGGPEDEWMKCGGALIRPDTDHAVDARDTSVLLAFVDVESELGSALGKRVASDIVSIAPDALARWRAMLGGTPSHARIERWVKTELLHRRHAVRIHPGVNRVVKYLRERVGVSDDFSLVTLAGISGLSESRFMHAFTQSVGVPLRPYIRWLRVQRAACELMNGCSVTEAAHSAGFSDASHLVRTFRRMMGTTPTELAFGNRTAKGVPL